MAPDGSLPPSADSPAKPFLLFLSGVGVLVLLRFAAGVLRFPLALVPAVNVLLAVLFLAVPIVSIAAASRGRWRPAHAFALIAVGVAIQALAIWAVLPIPGGPRIGGLGGLALRSLNQGALQIWCVGLGAVVATLVRERNILIPIAIFLAVFDLFLVLTPIGFTQKAIQAAPEVLANIGHAVPRIQAQGVPPSEAQAEVWAYVGPADLVFLGAYFLALGRFGIGLRRTVLWMIPTLALYLAFVLTTSIALPALLPIGAVTLLVNRKEFRLSRDEWASTGVVVALGVALLIYGATRPPARPDAPSNPPRARERGAPLPTPGRASEDRPRSSAPDAR